MAITVSGTNPTFVTVGSNTTTTNTTFNANAPFDRNYVFDDAVSGAINQNVSVTGAGLRLQSTLAGSAVSLLNNGFVFVDITGPAVQLVAEAGPITYSGTEIISNSGTGEGLSLINQGPGSVTATISNLIDGGDARAINVVTGAGDISLTQTAGSTVVNNENSGFTAMVLNSTAGNINLSLSGTIIGDLAGVFASSTSGNVTIDYDGSISGGSGLVVQNTAGAITINSPGDFGVTGTAISAQGTGANLTAVNVTGGQITADQTGVFASASGTGGIQVNMTGGQIGENGNRPVNGIVAQGTGVAGNVVITAGDIFASNFGVVAQILNAGSAGSLLVTANDSIISDNVGILVSNLGLNNTNVIVNGSVNGFTGVLDTAAIQQ